MEWNSGIPMDNVRYNIKKNQTNAEMRRPDYSGDLNCRNATDTSSNAIKSLTTTGIQQGNMKMHLMNILNQCQATASERKEVETHFKDQTVSHRAVVDIIEDLRK